MRRKMFSRRGSNYALLALMIAFMLILPIQTVFSSVSTEENSIVSNVRGEILFSDDFDDGTLNKWYVGPWNPAGVMEVTNAVSHSPNYSAHSQSDPGTNTAPYIATDFRDSNHVLIEGWIYLPQKTQEYDRFTLLQTKSLPGGLENPSSFPSSAFANTTYGLDIRLWDDDYSIDIRQFEREPIEQENLTMDVYTLQPETWYKLGIRIVSNHYEILVNDDIVYEGTRYDDRPVNITAFGDFGGSGGIWGDAYLDDVIVTELPEHTVDVSICDSDVSFSNPEPMGGEQITIQARIHGDYNIWENTTESEILFSDNFDDGTLNKWYVGPWVPSGVIEATNVVSYSPDYSAHSHSYPDTNSAPYIAADFNETYNVLIESWIYLPQKNQEFWKFRFLSPWYIENGTEGGFIGKEKANRLAMGLYDDNYNLDIFIGTGVSGEHEVIASDIYQFQPEVWYKVGMEMRGATLRVFVNDTLLLETTNYSQYMDPSYPFNVVFLGDMGGDTGAWGEAYWDDVVITGYTETQTLVHEAQNATCTVSFYLDEVSEDNLIYREENLSVPANGEVTVSAPWTAVEGNHTIIVKVGDTNPGDRDYSNNLASVFVSVKRSENFVDLRISDSDISFSEDAPVEEDLLTISATIHGDYDIWGNTTNSEILFSDDFDDGTLNKWYVGPWNPAGVMEVTNAVSHSPNYSAHSQSDPGTNTAPYVEAEFNETANVLMETWIYLPQKAQEYSGYCLLRSAYIEGGIGDGSDQSSRLRYALGVILYDDDYSIDILEKNATATFDVYSLQPETWYKIGLEVDSTYFRVFVNDSQIYERHRTNGTPVNVIFLGDIGGEGACWGDGYFDDVAVTGFTTVPTLVHHAQNATCTVSFYLDEVSEDNLIYREENVSVPANGEVTVSAPWTAVEGNHTIIVNISRVNPPDYDISNNIVIKNISVEHKNIPPVAEAGPDITAYVHEEVTFNASASYDPDGQILFYLWNFGDGSTGTGVLTDHTYTEAGIYNVTLIITDNEGASATDSLTVEVLPVPAHLEITKVKISGVDKGYVHTYYEWEMVIEVANTGWSDAIEIEVKDKIPHNLILVDYAATAGNVTIVDGCNGTRASSDVSINAAPSPPTTFPMKDTLIIWNIEKLTQGESQKLYLLVSTKSCGFCTPDTYYLNKGATVTGTDTLTGDEIFAGPTDPITAEISKLIVKPPANGNIELRSRNREPGTLDFPIFWSVALLGMLAIGLVRRRKFNR